MKTVSIVIPAWNAAATIRACLETVLYQTFPDYEVVVVDDGSTDATRAVVADFGDRVRVIRTEHVGAAAARNRGAAAASGEFLIFCDADMALDPTMLEKMVNVARRKPDVSFVYSGFIWHTRAMGMRPFDAHELRRNNYIHTSALIRREHFPGFDESLRRFQDWDLWLTIIKSGRRGIGIPLVLYAARAGVMSGRGGRKRLEAIRRVRAKHKLPMIPLDYWLSFKEWLRSLWT